MMAYGELNVVMNRKNFICHNGQNFVMKGQHLKKQIIKSKKVPIKKREKGSEVARNESKEMNDEQDDAMINEKDVMYVRLETKWEIDDSYKIID